MYTALAQEPPHLRGPHIKGAPTSRFVCRRQQGWINCIYIYRLKKLQHRAPVSQGGTNLPVGTRRDMKYVENGQILDGQGHQNYA